MKKKKGIGYGRYDFSSQGVLRDYNTDSKIVASDYPRRKSRFGGGVNINISSPRHVITEDFRDYHNRTTFQGNMNEGMIMFLLGLVMIGLSFYLFSIANILWGISLFLIGAAIVYMGWKFYSSSRRRYLNHFEQ